VTSAGLRNSRDDRGEARRFVTERLGEVSPRSREVVGLWCRSSRPTAVRHTTSDFTVEIERTLKKYACA
jgi:hypothetical protein